ncbi:MAG: dimethylarginine dimethylaminohydrolase family protein [Bacteroidota bacterium]
MPVAITREVSPRFPECELTHLERVPINLEVARAQHAAYTQALESVGCRITRLPAEPDFPDSVFVEDTALILPEVAVITRPGAASRRGETASIAEALRPYRELVTIQAPATLDGGDVLVLGREIYVGLSTRSGREAIGQLHEKLAQFGYRVLGVGLHGCLHLKSAVTRIHDDLLLIRSEWLDEQAFENYRLLEVAASEPYAANILMIGERGIYPTAFPHTQELLERRGVSLVSVDVSELAKAEGAVTCCSLIL